MPDSRRAVAALIASAVLLTAGCSGASSGSATTAPTPASSGHASAPRSSTGPRASLSASATPTPASLAALPPMVMTISAEPPDVPARRPACTGIAGLPLQVPPDLSGLISVCVNPAAYAPDVIMISNMSDDVLSISTASASQPALRAYYPVPGNHESSGTLIETNAQNEAVRGWPRRAAASCCRSAARSSPRRMYRSGWPCR